MKLARSTYYYRSCRGAAEKKVLRDRIEALCAEFPRDGYRRITYQLRAEGMVVNHKAVARLMPCFDQPPPVVGHGSDIRRVGKRDV